MVICSAAIDPANVAAQASISQTRSSASFEAFDHRFTDVTDVRELADGTLLVIDRREGQILAFARPSAPPRQVGRKGDGPAEYRSPAALVALAGDSTLLTDSRLFRWSLLVGTALQSRSPWPQSIARRVESAVLSVDASGRVYWIENLVDPRKKNSQEGRVAADSSVLERMSMLGGRIDTLARLRAKFGSLRMVTRVVMGVPSQYALNDPLRVPDQVAICSDGWIAVAYAQSGRVGWIRPDGGRVWGPMLRRRPAAATDELKRDAMDRFLSPSVAKYFTLADFPWSSDQPPVFAPKGVACAADGSLLVARYDLLSRPVVFDVVARSGKVVAPLVFPPRSRVVGVGRTVLYVAVPDEDDLIELRRYRWP